MMFPIHSHALIRVRKQQMLFKHTYDMIAQESA